MSEERVIWVKTEPSFDGKLYIVTVELSDDRAITLSPDSVLRYASAILDAAERAGYDAAVFHQMKQRLKGKLDLVGQVIMDLRKDRPPISVATAPLRLEPGVNSKGEPFLGLFLDGEQYGQWTIADARRHALHVLEAVHAADLDAGYHRVLTGVVGLDSSTARHVIDDLRHHREEEA